MTTATSEPAQFTDFYVTAERAQKAWSVDQAEAESKLETLRFTLKEMQIILDVVRHGDLDLHVDGLSMAQIKELEFKADMYAILLQSAE